MAGRSVSAVMVLGFLVVAAFCLQAEAGDSDSSGGLVNLNLDVILKLRLLNKLKVDVRLLLGETGEVLDVKAGAVGVLGPVTVKLQALDLLRVQIFLFGKDGELLKVKGDVTLNLSLLAKVVLGVKEVTIDLVEELVGEDGKLIKLIVDAKVIAVIKLGKDSDPSGPVVDVDALVKLSLVNKLKDINVRVVVKVGNVLNVEAGAVGVLGPVAVKLKVLDLLRVQVFLFGKDGKLLAVKARVLLNLKLLAKVVLGVNELVVDVVEELVGVDGKLIKLLVDAKVIAAIELPSKGH